MLQIVKMGKRQDIARSTEISARALYYLEPIRLWVICHPASEVRQNPQVVGPYRLVNCIYLLPAFLRPIFKTLFPKVIYIKLSKVLINILPLVAC